MKSCKLLFFPALILAVSISTFGQDPPNLQNGIPPQGSYAGTDADTVNLMNGNLTVHIPLPVSVPQRGKSGIKYYLVVNAKTWFAAPGNAGVGSQNQWLPATACSAQPPTASGPCGQGTLLVSTASFAMTRIYQSVFTDGQGTSYSVSSPDTLVTWDGASHPLFGAPETMDTSRYQVQITGSNFNGLPYNVTVTDPDGTQYIGNFVQDRSTCSTDPGNGLPGSTSTTTCSEHFAVGSVLDANGNVISTPLGIPDIANPNTNGPAVATHQASSSELNGCLTSFGTPWVGYLSYPGPNGQTNQIKLCFATYPQLATSFSPAGIHQFQDSYSGRAFPGNYRPPVYLTDVILPDNTQWSLAYDSYGEITSLGTPTGASIQYSWAEGQFPVSSQYDITSVSRAVHSRTLTDVNGNAFIWNYQWGAVASDATMTHTVTDPIGNDTTHKFSPIEGIPQVYHINYKETQTISYQGSGGSRTPLKQVDTTWQIKSGGGPGVPTDEKTTMSASGKVTLVHTDYDSSSPTLGLVTAQKHYDWGQGTTGPLLQEVDTVYQWQNDSRYLAANILEARASVVTRDGSGNRMAETDTTYDEAAYLTSYEGTVGALPAGTHLAAPNPVRGNPTTVSRWLNTGSAVVSHTNWYDTGEVYKAIDPLGYTTTHSYDLAYNGALSTETCNALSQCVSGTYDPNTGLLTSFTDANGAYQASGATPGDPAHTSTYSYDLMGRLTSAVLPKDANGNQPQTTFNYPDAHTAERLQEITTALTEDSFTYLDGLGHTSRTQHVTPNGNATVDTTYDGLGHAVTVTNPYFSTSDPTYGVIQTQYDALGRVTQVTKQDGSVSSVAYDTVPIQAVAGDCTKTTDEAGKQRLTCADGLGRLTEVHEPGDSFSGTQAQGSFSVGGNLQTYTIPGTNATTATGSVTISGHQQSIITTTRVCNQYSLNGRCVDWETDSTTTYDSGAVTITVNGQPYTYNYGANQQTDNVSSISSALQSTINNTSSYVQVSSVSVNLSANPPTATLYLQARSAGASGNFSLAASTSYNTQYFTQASFTAGASVASLTGGANGTNPSTVYDSGTVTVTIGSFDASAPYSQSGNSTAGQVAQALISSSNPNNLNRSGSPVTASVSGSTLTITYASIGAAGNVPISCGSSTSQGTYFSSPSFSCPATTALNGGYNPETASLDFNYFVTQYSYDALGNLLNVTQKGDPTVTSSSQYRVRSFTYDSLSRLLTATNPESGQISYSYDADGNMLQKTSPAPNQTGSATQTLSYCYDKLNRVTGKAYSAQTCTNGQLPSGTAVVTYAYDAGANGIGHLTSLTDQAGSGSYSFDALGRIGSESRTIAGIQKNLSYTYNLDNSVATLKYPSGAVVTYTPDAAGRILSAVDSGNNINYITGATYGPDSSLTGFISGNSSSFAGITNTFSYNTRLQPCRLSATTGTQPASCTDGTNIGNVIDLSYDFHLGSGNNGNVFRLVNNKDLTRIQTFTYDALNRLTSAQNAGTDCSQTTLNGKTKFWGNAYVYDAWGNLLQKTVTKCSAENLSVTALANNQLSGYNYDAAGNMTHDATTNLNYSFDQENRITGAAGYTYTYDADGNRVEKSNGSTGTIYWYMSPGIVGESDLTGSLKSEYVFFDGERVARKDLPGSTVSYYFSDHLKTASVITDSAGIIKEDEDYYPWGGELQFVNNDNNHYKFTSKERDLETGLDYFGARYYGNWLGRFVSADWAAKPEAVPYSDLHDPQSLNLYSYVRNIPTSDADPDGHAGAMPELNEGDGDDALRKKSPSTCPGLSDCSSSPGATAPQRSTAASVAIGVGKEAANQLKSMTGIAGLGMYIQQPWNFGLLRDALAVMSLPDFQAANPTQDKAMKFTFWASFLIPFGGEEAAASKIEGKVVSVYLKSLTEYVGITKNLLSRQAAHGEELLPIVKGLTRTEAKGVEQAIIEKRGLAKNGGTLTNKINSIARTNPIYEKAVQFGRDLLKSMGLQ